MEQQIKDHVTQKKHSLELFGQTKGSVCGVNKVISSSETSLILDTSCGGLSILGSGFKINKFSLEEGVLTFEGLVSSVKYSAAKISVFKRIFK